MTASRIHDKSIELADPGEIQALQTARLVDVVRHTQATNEFYRDLWREQTSTSSASTRSRRCAALVPMVAKSRFVDDQHRPSALRQAPGARIGLGERLEIYTTSGTSGQGVEIHAQTERELDAMVEMYRYMFRWAGLEPGRRGGADAAAHDARRRPHRVAGRASARAHRAARRQHRRASEAGAARALPAEGAVRLDVVLRPSARDRRASRRARRVEVLLTGLEGVGFSYLEQLQPGWDAVIADRFGCTQVRADFMFTCEHGIGTRRPPRPAAQPRPVRHPEVIDVETGLHVADGEFGELVVTSLYHLDNPVIRCRLRDGGVWHPARYCSCGRPLRRRRGGLGHAHRRRQEDQGHQRVPAGGRRPGVLLRRGGRVPRRLTPARAWPTSHRPVMLKGEADGCGAHRRRPRDRIGIQFASRWSTTSSAASTRCAAGTTSGPMIGAVSCCAWSRPRRGRLLRADGDNDPLHVDAAFAATTIYKERIAPGALIIGYMMAAAAAATGNLGLAVPRSGSTACGTPAGAGRRPAAHRVRVVSVVDDRGTPTSPSRTSATRPSRRRPRLPDAP